MTQQQLIRDLPDWVPTEAWEEFLKMRKAIKKPLATEYGQKLALKSLDKLRVAGFDPEEVLNYAIENSNQGLFPPRGATPQRQRPQQQFQTPVEKARTWAEGITGRQRQDDNVIDINDTPVRRLGA